MWYKLNFLFLLVPLTMIVIEIYLTSRILGVQLQNRKQEMKNVASVACRNCSDSENPRKIKMEKVYPLHLIMSNNEMSKMSLKCHMSVCGKKAIKREFFIPNTKFVHL